jgi:hypothetical protein
MPIGARAGKYARYITKLCSRCGIEEDDTTYFSIARLLELLGLVPLGLLELKICSVIANLSRHYASSL